MKTTSETTARRHLNKLQAAIVDGLEDIKGQDILVFDTAALSPLFERVVIASASSTRQTKALAASVRDKIREAGFDKPRVEGEENGEWVIVDCGTVVVHIMQPSIRSYYRLEEIWGDKPVKTAASRAASAKNKTATGKAGAGAGEKAGEPDSDQAPQAEAEKKAKPAARKTAAKKTTGKTGESTRSAGTKSAATKSAATKSAATKSAATKSAATKSASKKTASKKAAG